MIYETKEGIALPLQPKSTHIHFKYQWEGDKFPLIVPIEENQKHL